MLLLLANTNITVADATVANAEIGDTGTGATNWCYQQLELVLPVEGSIPVNSRICFQMDPAEGECPWWLSHTCIDE